MSTSNQPARTFGAGFANLLAAALLSAAALPGIASAASLNIYISAPGDQSTYIAGATTETFNSLPLGLESTPYVSPVGTYQFSSSSHFAVLSADQYGGASGSQYVALGAQSHSSTPVTLALNKPADYFGFWWSAGDPNNGLSFYANRTLLARLTTADIITLLNSSSNGMVTAVNGSTYKTNSYYGNPNSGYDASEPFAYVHIFAQGVAFNKVVFDNSGTTATGFESDNQSVFSGAAQPNGSSVFVESVRANELVPEPVSFMLTGLGLVAIAMHFRRRCL